MRASPRLLPLAATVLAMCSGAELRADDDWPLCGTGFRLPDRPVSEAVGSGVDPDTIRLFADHAEHGEEGVSRLRGNVVAEQGMRRLQSDELVYDPSEGVIEARGDIEFWDEGVFVSGDRARAEVKDDVMAVESVTSFMLEDERGHGNASEIEVSGRERVTGRDATYTTCSPGDADWRITASRIEIDRVEAIGTARNLWLELEGQRVFYLPWISFSLSDRRKSGFLAPTYGTSESSGIEATVPYYFNLAPNYDATLAARAMSERGVQARGELRFLSRTYGFNRLAAQHLPYDAKFDDDRTALEFVHRHRWSDRWSTDAHTEWVSDPGYFRDLAVDLSQSSRTYQSSRFDARYRGDGWGALVRLQDFQTLDRTILPRHRPHARLPHILLRTDIPERNRALNIGAAAEFTYFEQRLRTSGARVDLQPSVSWPIRTAGTFVIPKATLHFTGYDLNRTEAETASDDTPSRLLPGVSLDSGLFLERPVILQGRSLIHTIEPRLHYLHVPFESQDGLPNFDTGRPAFSFAQLFRENRFSGRDRIGDAHQLTFALTSRLLDERGGERVRASIGQIRYFQDRRVVLGESAGPETTSASDIVAEIAARPGRKWHLQVDFQYDTDAQRTERNTFHVRYRPMRRSIVNAAYRLVRDVDPARTIEQADLSFALPIGVHWSMVGRWSFALGEDRILQAFGGLEYESCCLAFRAMARRFIGNVAPSDDEVGYFNGLYLQIELKGLTGKGSRTDTFLTRNLPGYENEF